MECPPCPHRLLSRPQPSPRRAEKSLSVTSEAGIHLQATANASLFSRHSFQLPGLRKFLSKVENWAEVLFPEGPTQMPAQSTEGQARSTGSYKCHPGKASKLARAEPQSDLCVEQLADSGGPQETWQTGEPASSPQGGTEARPLLVTNQGCGRERALRHGLSDIVHTTGFAFPPERKLRRPGAVNNCR